MMKLLVVLLFIGAAVAQSTDPTTLDTVDDNPLEEGPREESDDDIQMLPGVWRPFNGRSFMFIRSPMPWSRAQTHCMTLGGTLASIHNAQEDNFVTGLTQGSTWIGLSDAQTEGYWLWINSQPMTYTKWCPGEPNDGNGGTRQHCGTINWNGKQCWDDGWCDYNLPFVCVKKEIC